MLLVFVMVPALVSAAGAAFSLIGGMGFVTTAAAINGWQRYKGYKPGEGHLTERANNKYYGVCLNISDSYDVSQGLGKLAQAAPKMFSKFVGHEFDMTRTEGEFLRVLMAPALVSAGDLDAAKELVTELGDDEAMNLLYETADRLAAVVLPVVRWLEQFPKARVRKAS